MGREGEDEEDDIDILGISDDDDNDSPIISPPTTTKTLNPRPRSSIPHGSDEDDPNPKRRKKAAPTPGEKKVKTSVTEQKIGALRKRETELVKRIDELKVEIRMLEALKLKEVADGESGETTTMGDTNMMTMVAVDASNAGEGVEDDVSAIDIENEVMEVETFKPPPYSIPICANVLSFDFKTLGQTMQFDVIMMDPPWQLASHAPSRGVAIGYDQLPDSAIESLPLHLLQTDGFIFVWVINAKYTKAFELFEKWGYTYCDDITWVKRTVNRRMAKGKDPPNCRNNVASDVIYAERRGQSQKPEELYQMVEELAAIWRSLDAKNNLRDYWVRLQIDARNDINL
ncbi:MT-A70-domain-containing protein [Chytridium lagenaria]|nr:MT-A70-domain-containing protein [Chytridium lagenaria]